MFTKNKKKYIELNDFDNVKIIISPIKGQVQQRIFGLKKSTQNYVLQLDDDTIVHSNDLIKIINKLKQLGPGNAISPINCDIEKKISVTQVEKNLKSLLFNIFSFFLAGSKWGVNKMGTISKSGVVYGVDPNYVKNKTIHSQEWLSGCCVAMFKQDLILDCYYPFSGKAYFEDVIHSIILRKRKVKLWSLISAKCYTRISKEIMEIEDINQHFIAQKYCASLVCSNLIPYYRWMLFYKSYLKVKHFFKNI